MGTYLDILYDFLGDPDRAAGRVLERRPLGLALLSLVLSALSFYVAQEAAAGLDWGGLFGVVLVATWGLAHALALTAFLRLSTGAPGLGLFILMSLSELAWTLAVPAAMLARLVNSRAAAPALFFLIGLLSLALKARGVRQAGRLPAAEAWLQLGFAYVACLFFIGAAAAYAVWRCWALAAAYLS